MSHRFIAPIRVLAPIAVPLALATAARADVLTVGSGELYPQIQAAVDAALDGDVILVRSGSYQAVSIDDKSLVVVADGGADVVVKDLDIQNLLPTRSVAVHGMHVDGGVGDVIVNVSSNAGPVHLERITLDDFARIRVRDSSSVTLVDCANDDPGSNYSLGFGPTVQVRDSSAFLYGGHFVSMKDYGALDNFGSFVFASGSTFEGQDATSGLGISGDCYSNAKHGGYGIRMRGSTANPNPELITQECTLDPGAPYDGPPTDCAGDPGEALIVEEGTHTELESSAHGYTTSTPVRDGEGYALTFEGEPGELVLLLISAAQSPVYLADFHGGLVPSAPLIIPAGAIPAGGTLEIQGVMDIPDTLDALTLYEQAGFIGAGQAVLGQPRVAQVLGASF